MVRSTCFYQTGLVFIPSCQAFHVFNSSYAVGIQTVFHWTAFLHISSMSEEWVQSALSPSFWLNRCRVFRGLVQVCWRYWQPYSRKSQIRHSSCPQNWSTSLCMGNKIWILRLFEFCTCLRVLPFWNSEHQNTPPYMNKGEAPFTSTSNDHSRWYEGVYTRCSLILLATQLPCSES